MCDQTEVDALPRTSIHELTGWYCLVGSGSINPAQMGSIKLDLPLGIDFGNKEKVSQLVAGQES